MSLAYTSDPERAGVPSVPTLTPFQSWSRILSVSSLQTGPFSRSFFLSVGRRGLHVIEGAVAGAMYKAEVAPKAEPARAR